jgi:hypothetical protein
LQFCGLSRVRIKAGWSTRAYMACKPQAAQNFAPGLKGLPQPLQVALSGSTAAWLAPSAAPQELQNFADAEMTVLHDGQVTPLPSTTFSAGNGCGPTGRLFTALTGFPPAAAIFRTTWPVRWRAVFKNSRAGPIAARSCFMAWATPLTTSEKECRRGPVRLRFHRAYAQSAAASPPRRTIVRTVPNAMLAAFGFAPGPEKPGAVSNLMVPSANTPRTLPSASPGDFSRTRRFFVSGIDSSV